MLLSHDYIVIGSFIFLDVFILTGMFCDCFKNISIKLVNIVLYKSDLVFISATLFLLLFFVLNGYYGYINKFLGLVNFYDAEDEIIRARIVSLFVIKFVAGGILFSLICAVISLRRKMSMIKWFILGMLFNVSAFICLLWSKEYKTE